MSIFTTKVQTLKAFAASTELSKVTDPFVPSKTIIPEWYKNIRRTHEDSLIVEDHHTNLSVKACMPYYDALSMGYVMPLWADVQVRQLDGGPRLTWKTQFEPIAQRSDPPHNSLPPYPGFTDWFFAWNAPWGIKPPKGYSLLITQPLNRPELPFMVSSGLVEADEFAHPGLVSFCLQKDFEGVIKAGTPMFQVIPFKREDWELTVEQNLLEEESVKRHRNLGKITNGYKKEYWKPKKFD